ncbi:hypothetical protein KIJ04_05520 [Leuconostoc gelidum subsp. gelidum]|uniref:hypothetical protein n=1 Tax=Leuconostoc gelidum TaxID=1244 RepID=UPI001CC57514|nr:hypothetical protein [Leuconostoc gelidum]MBZ6014205.1 hypothetical protein [Leuconostoc gelidum subsp. gelidum]
MQITGEKALENISEDAIYFYKDHILDGDHIALDNLFMILDEHIHDDNFIHIAGEINGGITEGGTTLTLETNIVNLPLRYTNQLKKLIWPEKEDNQVNIYMIIENVDVSQSNLKIALASSVAAYLDDAASVKIKMSQWFDEQLANIVIAQNKIEENDASDNKTSDN